MKFESDIHEASVENTPEKKLYFKNPSLLIKIFFFFTEGKIIWF